VFRGAESREENSWQAKAPSRAFFAAAGRLPDRSVEKVL
jgi:hypothetical protein